MARPVVTSCCGRKNPNPNQRAVTPAKRGQPPASAPLGVNNPNQVVISSSKAFTLPPKTPRK